MSIPIGKISGVSAPEGFLRFLYGGYTMVLQSRRIPWSVAYTCQSDLHASLCAWSSNRQKSFRCATTCFRGPGLCNSNPVCRRTQRVWRSSRFHVARPCVPSFRPRRMRARCLAPARWISRSRLTRFVSASTKKSDRDTPWSTAKRFASRKTSLGREKMMFCFSTYLRVPPWPAASQTIFMSRSFRSPRDKTQQS